jgi:hypothetical protein
VLCRIKIKAACVTNKRSFCSFLLSTTSSGDLGLLDTSDLLDSALDFLSLLSGLAWFSEETILFNINKYLEKKIQAHLLFS